MASIAPPSALGQIKGLAFREFLRWYSEQHGSGPIVSAITRMGAQQRSLFNLATDAYGVLPSAWYPAELVHRILDRVSEGMSRPELEQMARDAATPIMGAMIDGVYQYAFSRLVSPGRWLALRQYIWDMYYDTGVLESELLDANTVRTWFYAWRGHHPLACLLTRSSNLAIYRAMGCTDVHIELSRCVSQGHRECEVWVRFGEGAGANVS